MIQIIFMPYCNKLSDTTYSLSANTNTFQPSTLCLLPGVSFPGIDNEAALLLLASDAFVGAIRRMIKSFSQRSVYSC